MRLSAIGLLCLASCAAQAREIRIAADAGGAPVIAPAIAAAAPGDVIRLAPGVYRECVTLTRTLTLEGGTGVVLDPSQPFRAEWRPAGAIGPGVFRAAAPRRPATLFLGGKVLAEIDERRTGGDGPWSWQKLLAVGPPLSGYRFIRAIWIYRSDEHAIYLHLEHEADPAGLALSAVWQRTGIVTFRGATGAAIRGLTLTHGYTGVSILDGSRGCTVSHCAIGPWDRYGVELRSGAAASLVEDNEIFRGSFEDWTPDLSRERYEIWLVHKEAGFYDRVGVDLVRAGAGNRIHANHIHETFDGIDLGDAATESLDKPLHDPNDGRDTEIWDNVIERTRDSGIELGVGCINVRVHNNVLRQTHGGLRYKAPRIGPVFIYRNVLIDGSPFNIWYSMDDSTAEGYVYHNTIIGSASAALAYGSFVTPHHLGAPHWRYLNNLIIDPQGFFQNRKMTAPVNFISDYNVVAGGNRPYPDDPAKDSHSRYVAAVPLAEGFPPRPLPGSAAIGAGLDLSTYYHGKPLPGCEPGYFSGKAPNAGAY